MFPCKFALSTRSLDELAARRAIRALEGFDREDVRSTSMTDQRNTKEW